MSSPLPVEDILDLVDELTEQRRKRVEHEQVWREQVRRAAEFSEMVMFNRSTPTAFRDDPPVQVGVSTHTNV